MAVDDDGLLLVRVVELDRRVKVVPFIAATRFVTLLMMLFFERVLISVRLSDVFGLMLTNVLSDETEHQSGELTYDWDVGSEQKIEQDVVWKPFRVFRIIKPICPGIISCVQTVKNGTNQQRQRQWKTSCPQVDSVFWIENWHLLAQSENQMHRNDEKDYEKKAENIGGAFEGWYRHLLFVVGQVPNMRIPLSITSLTIKETVRCNYADHWQGSEEVEYRDTARKFILSARELFFMLIFSGAQVIIAPLVDVQRCGNCKQHRGQRINNDALTVEGVVNFIGFLLFMSVLFD